MEQLAPSISRSFSYDGERSERSLSDGETQAVEVLFAPEDVRRRKSSLVASNAEEFLRKPKCYVHSFFQGQQKSGKYSPEQDLTLTKSVDKDVSDPRPDSSNGHHEPRHSRLLTKKQLSEMANGVRDLAKKLAHIQVKIDVRNIFILVKAHDASLVKNARELTQYLLLKDARYNVYVEHTLKDKKDFKAQELINLDPSFEKRLKYWDNELCKKRPQTFDVILSLGGDGTVLYASWLFQRIVPPVLSFAMGSLGFLTKFDYGSYGPTLDQAFARGITVSLRLRFEGTVMRSQKRIDTDARDIVEELIGEESEDAHTHKPEGTHNILNEVVIDRGPNATMSTLEVFGDNDHFTTIQADGICVATPTGSTAYNLAAGGSLCHPDNPVILMTAICAHTLSFRPIILPDTIVLRIGVPYNARTGSWASFDGRERVELNPGDYVTISASRYPFPSVLPLNKQNEDWIDSISRTLHWNSREKQKAFTGSKS